MKTAYVISASNCFGSGNAMRAGLIASRCALGLSPASRPMGYVHCGQRLDPRENTTLPGEDCA